MLDILKECHIRLEKVSKGLNSYLESKRGNFPRFYFLSDSELLEILSETKDPLKVQPHLKKCFEGIQKLEFNDKKEILGMYSSETEYVKYLELISTTAANGNVDEWLLWVEDAMIKSIKHFTEVALNDFPTKKRSEWVIDRCGMCVLGIN